MGLTLCLFLPVGDFAVLLKAGMTVRQAIVYNLLSALMAYFGMVIGTAVGQYTHNVTSWIFAITAGMFLYVALVDMVSINTLPRNCLIKWHLKLQFLLTFKKKKTHECFIVVEHHVEVDYISLAIIQLIVILGM